MQPKNLFLYHMRKAGGTSLRSYCSTLAEARAVRFDVIEGRSLKDEELVDTSPATIRVISLREPIARIKSSYRYEGRWRIKETQCRPDNAKSFADWIQESRERSKSGSLWLCISNYYIKALIGFPNRGAVEIGRTELELAKERLALFDVVLITQWMSEPETALYVQEALGGDGYIEALEFPTAVPRPVEDDSMLFDDGLLAQLQEENQLDSELYQFACELFKQRCSLHCSARTFTTMTHC